ncbi:MAG: S41 family peptidase [Rikenellaceae bacterium]
MKVKRILLPLLGVLALISVRAAVRGDFALVRDTEIMVNMLRALNENYVDTLSTTKLLRDATAGISRSLDPYTSYIDESEMEDFEIMTTGKYGGIGAIIRQNSDYVTIAQPYKGSPADEGGLLIGDRIIEIDGVSAKGLTTSEVSSRLKGTPGSRVKLIVGSVIDSVERKVTLKRRRISIPSVPYYTMVDERVGYLKHTDFTDGCSEEIRTALVDLKSRGMEALVLDYRSNGGGVMQEAIKTLSLFVPKGSEVLKIKGRRDSTIYNTEETPILPNTPIVVLIDESSASAAEIVAGALQDMDRAVLVGQRSFGKGLVQSTVPVGYDSYLKLTTARYYTPSGRCIQAVDYTDHSDDRRVVRVADSLRREFTTLGGRKVYDGGGVTPDVEMEVEYVSRFAATLYAQGIVEEWGEEYYRRNHSKPFDAAAFEIEEADFESFAEFVSTREVKYESQVSRAITALEKAAEADRNDELDERLKAFKEGINDDVADNLKRYRDEIEEYLKQDILLRFSYLEGVLINSVARDKEVKRAREILASRTEIVTLLSPHSEDGGKL